MDLTALLQRGQSGEPRASAQRILRDVVDSAPDVEYAAIYELDLATGCYELWTDSEPSGSNRTKGAQKLALRAGRQLSDDSKREHPLLRSVAEKRALTTRTVDIDASGGQGESVLAPLFRDNTAVAVLRVDAARAPGLPESELEARRAVIGYLLERRFVLRLFDNLPQAVDLQVSEDEYLDEITLLIHASARMEFLALRELDDAGDRLGTIALWGFDPDTAKTEFDLQRGDPKSQPFFNCLEQKSAESIPSVTMSQLAIHSMAPGVESFVVAPVIVGGKPFGTLSFATSCEYEYSDVERLGFETIANTIGIAILNYRNFHEAAENIADLRELSKSITAVELAQAARHEARVILDTCQTELANLQHAISKSRQIDALGAVDRTSDALGDIESALDKIRDAQMAPVRDASQEEVASLKDLFLTARSYALGKLNSERIRCEYEGPELRARVSKAWMRNVFANLILNSIDAYATGSAPKRGRWITLRAEKPEGRARDFSLVYQDEAGGINPATLSRPRDRHREMPIEQLIFERDVTSKRDGTGYGLFIARRVINDLGGSIELTNYRRGIALAISLPMRRLVQ